MTDGNLLDSGQLINYILSMALRKIDVPFEFEARTKAIEQMLQDDVSGLVDVLTDFSVQSASVDFNIFTSNSKLNEILRNWLENINVDFMGRIPMGIDSLAKQYFQERWKGSSFCVLKIAKWKKDPSTGLELPVKMYFLDGKSINHKDKNENSDYVSLLQYDYYLGNNDSNKLDGENYIYSRPYSKWFDKYPTPFLIKRGVYHNWQIIKSLKNHGSKVLEQIIPYLFLVQKGTENLAQQGKFIYSDTQLKDLINEFQSLMNEIKSSKAHGKDVQAPIRTTHFDEKIKHLIPDLSTMFEPKLFAQAEKNILSGLGFVDIAEGITASRRESILNPKAFVKEVKSAVKDFSKILSTITHLIKKRNSSHVKYNNETFKITNSPVTAFMSDKFKNNIRQLYDRGRISSQTAVEVIAEKDFETEILRRKQETKDGIERIMYPVITRNQEEKGIDLPEKKEKDEDKKGKPIPDDKKDPNEKKEYDIGKVELHTAPYKNIKELPKRVKENMSKSLQKIFVRVFNQAYETYNDETRAFKVAWEAVTKIARKNKDGKWVKKSSRKKLDKSLLNELINKSDMEDK